MASAARFMVRHTDTLSKLSAISLEFRLSARRLLTFQFWESRLNLDQSKILVRLQNQNKIPNKFEVNPMYCFHFILFFS